MSELEISVGELQEKKKAGESFLLIDVREPWEYDLCRIAGAKLIPMGTIPANLQQLDGDEQVICYCHHGQRSLEVAAWLRAQGVEQAQSLAGGIERWSLEIDPSVPRY
jgi:rhodanese-related sulfurtransferase